jgi:hypothetical protein
LLSRHILLLHLSQVPFQKPSFIMGAATLGVKSVQTAIYVLTFLATAIVLGIFPIMDVSINFY